MKTSTTLSKLTAILLIAGQIILSKGADAQNLIVNPGFSNGTTGWSTQCSIEINPETVYGGTNASNVVTEIDVERCINQEIAVSAGAIYDVSFKASRRQGGSTPATVGIRITITGVQSGTQYINATYTYKNKNWNYATENFSFTIPANATDTKVNIKFSNYTTTGTYGTLIDDINVSVNSLSSILPLRLMAFVGEVKNDHVVLNWTASNDDNDGKYFIVERADAQGAFDSIGVVAVGGISYSFTDKTILKGQSSYRLKIVSLAAVNYSKIISFTGAKAYEAQVYPNPATASIRFTLSSPVRKAASIRLYSASGGMVATRQQQLNAGVNTGTIDIQSLRPGLYFIQISDGAGMDCTMQFCKR